MRMKLIQVNDAGECCEFAAYMYIVVKAVQDMYNHPGYSEYMVCCSHRKIVYKSFIRTAYCKPETMERFHIM